MSYEYMLDTDTVSFAMRGVGDVKRAIVARAPNALCMSAITLAELRYGADHRRSRKIHGVIDAFAASVAVVPFDEAAASRFGAVAAAFVREGTPIGEYDALIAAHAISLGVTLVTNNTKHFGRVHGLRIENWA